MAVLWAFLALGGRGVRVQEEDCADGRRSLLLNSRTLRNAQSGQDERDGRRRRKDDEPPLIKGVYVTGMSAGWIGADDNNGGHSDGVVDGNPATLWSNTNIPAIIEVEFPMHYRVERMRLVNDDIDGADQVELSAGDASRPVFNSRPTTADSNKYFDIQTFRYSTGEDRVLEFKEPVIARKFRLTFPTFHMDAVSVRDIQFFGYNMDDAWMHQREIKTIDELKQMGQAAAVGSDEELCPKLKAFPEHSLEGLARWAEKRHCEYCAKVENKVFVLGSEGQWLGTIPSWESGWPNLQVVQKDHDANGQIQHWEFGRPGPAPGGGAPPPAPASDDLKVPLLTPFAPKGAKRTPGYHTPLYASNWYKTVKPNQSLLLPPTAMRNWTKYVPGWKNKIDFNKYGKAWERRRRGKVSDADKSTSEVQLNEAFPPPSPAPAKETLGSVEYKNVKETVQTRLICAALACLGAYISDETARVERGGNQMKDVRCTEMLKGLCETWAHEAGCTDVPYACTGTATDGCVTTVHEYRGNSFDIMPDRILKSHPKLAMMSGRR